MAHPIVVSDTTPLIAIARLTRLDLLSSLFDTVHIPQAVYDETHSKPESAGASELASSPWLKVAPDRDALAVNLLLTPFFRLPHAVGLLRGIFAWARRAADLQAPVAIDPAKIGGGAQRAG